MQAFTKTQASLIGRSKLLPGYCRCQQIRKQRLAALSRPSISSNRFVASITHNSSFDNCQDVRGILTQNSLLTYDRSVSLQHNRYFSLTSYVRDKEPLKPSSKVEETVKVIKEKKEKSDEAKAGTVSKIEEKKAPLLTRVWNELVHYYHGFRLLFIDINVSRKLFWRVLNGKQLSRREHKLLVRTVGDVFRLVPFSVFIIVPFMELLLPLAIKLFPGMLPSTFQTTTERDGKLKQSLKVRLEMAKFLQTTLDDMSVQAQDKNTQSAKEFTDFFRKIRTTGEAATTEEILKFSKLFEDEITLDSLSRQQLTALCRVLDLNTVGMTSLLRFQIRMKLRSLVADDKMIEKEGIDSLTITELQQACQARAMRAYGVSEEKLRAQLAQWLDLSLNEKVPPSLLLLSRALMLPEDALTSDQLKATISALPDTVELKAAAAISEREGVIDNKTKIELIKAEELKIKEERAELREERKRAKEEELVDKAPIIGSAEAQKSEEISTKDLETLEDALDTLTHEKRTLIVEKEELDDLKEELQEYQEDVKELNEFLVETDSKEQVQETKAAQNLFKKVNSMIAKMDTVLADLEEKGKKLAEMDEKEKEKTEELVRIDELMEVIKRIQKVPDDARLAQISGVLSKIDDDRDGAISVDEVLKVIELIGKENVQLTTKQLDEILQLLEKEEVLELEGQIEKALEKQASSEKSASSAKDKKESSSGGKRTQNGNKPIAASAMAVSGNGSSATITEPKASNQGASATITEPKDSNNGPSKQL